MSRPHHRPMTPGAAFFEAVMGGTDPAVVSEAADRAATLLVRGARESGDAEVAHRLVGLVDTEGLETLADLWAGAPAETLAGCLWRLYVLRSWVYADPVLAARQFEAGRASAQVARVVSGVADPPGPDQLRGMVDQVLAGIVTGDFADVLLRAAAFARVVAAGRAHLHQTGHDEEVVPEQGGPEPVEMTVRMLTLAEQLEAAGHLELRGELG